MIKFKTITMKNFLSVGDNPLTIIIDKSPTTIISGQNGVGKTATVLDSISFALFGKSFRDIKKAAMINSVNQRDSVVELIFAKGSNEYKIIRGQKPHRLEVFVNNKIMNETAALSDMQKYIENEILGFDLSAFSRVVLMSTMNYIPFLNLSAYERRNFVETMLNLSVFTEMNKQHKANISKLKDRANFIDTEIDKTEISIKEKSEFLKYIQNSLTQEITTNKQQLTGLLKDIENLSKDLTKIEEEVKLFEIDSLNKDLIKLKNELNDIKSEETIVKHTLKENKNNIKFLETHDVCNHCKQDITDDYKQTMISDYTKNTEIQTKNLEKIIKKENKISEKYDIIVSNPPYISREDESEVGLNVLHSEPHLALFADEDGLAIYRRIAEDAKDYLTDGGKIYLEIGYKQGQSVPELFRKHLPEKRVRTLKDQFGQDRMVVVDDGQD